MNKKGLTLFSLFIASISLTMLFQNCGKSTARSNSSNNDGLQVEVIPNGGDGTGGDGTGGDGTGGSYEFSFNMSRGDSLYYTDDDNSSTFRSLRIFSTLYNHFTEVIISEEANTNLSIDLPTNYCSNSALPHCLHLNSLACRGEGCQTNTDPVACHWEERVGEAKVNNALNAAANLVFHTRQVDSSVPYVSGCDNPNLFFYSDVISDLNVSLAEQACVAPGKYYTSAGADNMATLLSSELDSIESKSEMCNNYATYHWKSTKWRYTAHSGYTTQLQSSFREVSYENEFYQIKWKNAGDATTYCASDVSFNQYDAFFPADGLVYKIHRPNGMIADAPTSEVTYEDTRDAGSVRHFYLNDITSRTHGGGAVLKANHSNAITAAVELLITRADAFNKTTTNCP